VIDTCISSSDQQASKEQKKGSTTRLMERMWQKKKKVATYFDAAHALAIVHGAHAVLVNRDS
jgi:hypothetical protein